MPYGMKNAPAAIQRLMNDLTRDLHNCVTYIDDVVVYSDTRKEHLSHLHALFQRLSNANLVLNLTKRSLGKPSPVPRLYGRARTSQSP